MQGLNPFFIRSAVGIYRFFTSVGTVSLNPFFIRSAVGIRYDGGCEHAVRS